MEDYEGEEEEDEKVGKTENDKENEKKSLKEKMQVSVMTVVEYQSVSDEIK